VTTGKHENRAGVVFEIKCCQHEPAATVVMIRQDKENLPAEKYEGVCPKCGSLFEMSFPKISPYVEGDTERTLPPNGVQSCSECGKPTYPGSGRFVNRVPDFNDAKTKENMGRPFPHGNFICAECDDKSSCH